MYINFDPFRQLDILTRNSIWLDTESQEFKDRWIENPDWKKKKLQREAEQLKDRKEYYQKAADEYLRYAAETKKLLEEKEKTLKELKT